MGQWEWRGGDPYDGRPGEVLGEEEVFLLFEVRHFLLVLSLEHNSGYLSPLPRNSPRRNVERKSRREPNARVYQRDVFTPLAPRCLAPIPAP